MKAVAIKEVNQMWFDLAVGVHYTLRVDEDGARRGRARRALRWLAEKKDVAVESAGDIATGLWGEPLTIVDLRRHMADCAVGTEQDFGGDCCCGEMEG